MGRAVTRFSAFAIAKQLDGKSVAGLEKVSNSPPSPLDQSDAHRSSDRLQGLAKREVMAFLFAVRHRRRA
jgi:hypothetical protein